MKLFRSVIVIAIVCAICLTLVSCGLKTEDVIGEWIGTYTYDGNIFNVSFTINPDGTYSKTIIKNGDLHKTETGEYYIEGNELNLHSYENTGDTPYKYKNGVLVNNDHEFMRVG